MIMVVGDGDLERLDESVKQNPNANTPPVKNIAKGTTDLRVEFILPK